MSCREKNIYMVHLKQNLNDISSVEIFPPSNLPWKSHRYPTAAAGKLVAAWSRSLDQNRKPPTTSQSSQVLIGCKFFSINPHTRHRSILLPIGLKLNVAPKQMRRLCSADCCLKQCLRWESCHFQQTAWDSCKVDIDNHEAGVRKIKLKAMEFTRQSRCWY